MKPFKSFLAETYDANHSGALHETLESLRKLVTRRFPQLTKDNDATVLVAIAQTFLLKDVLFVSGVELADDIKHVIKVFLVAGDRYLDTTGLYGKAKMMSKTKLNQSNFAPKTFIGTIATLMKYAELPGNKSPLNAKEQSELHAFITSFYEKLNASLE